VSTSGTDARPAPAEVRPPGPPAPPKSGSFTGRALILALVAATLLLTLAVPVRAWFAQRAEIAGLRADVESARSRVAALEIQKQRWEDPAFVAAEARRRLHFVLPGEVGFVTLGSEASIAAEASDAGPTGPWYASLWDSLQEADDHAAAAK
jgi:cell division protein FtsB